jgi:hypothetical protein
MTTQKLYLWSLRHSVARGSYWQIEREITQDTSKQWLMVFAADEPQVRFQVARNRPKL